jgi:hypothetical protein
MKNIDGPCLVIKLTGKMHSELVALVCDTLTGDDRYDTEDKKAVAAEVRRYYERTPRCLRLIGSDEVLRLVTTADDIIDFGIEGNDIYQKRSGVALLGRIRAALHSCGWQIKRVPTDCGLWIPTLIKTALF